MSDEAKFACICALVVELTALKLKECPHLVIENFACDLLRKLLSALEPQ